MPCPQVVYYEASYFVFQVTHLLVCVWQLAKQMIAEIRVLVEREEWLLTRLGDKLCSRENDSVQNCD